MRASVKEQSQEKQLKHAHLPFLTPYRCSPQELLGKGWLHSLWQTLQMSPEEQRPAATCLLGDAMPLTQLFLWLRGTSTYGAFGEEDGAWGISSLIEKPLEHLGWGVGRMPRLEALRGRNFCRLVGARGSSHLKCRHYSSFSTQEARAFHRYHMF